MNLAMYGGTFDPVHNAHLAVAREVADAFALDRVLFIPAARPPHKAGVTHASYEDRVRMLDLALAGDPRFAVSRLEEGTARSYSIDTIEKLRATLAPADQLFFVIGSDAFAEIRTWYRWRDVARALRFLVVSRPGALCDVPEGVDALRFHKLDLPVSSSEVRRALAAGERPAEIPPPVLAYILQHGLYRTGVPAGRPPAHP
jgi:nicotinate-nucleotide adenylyltransferase